MAKRPRKPRGTPRKPISRSRAAPNLSPRSSELRRTSHEPGATFFMMTVPLLRVAGVVGVTGAVARAEEGTIIVEPTSRDAHVEAV